MSLKPTLVVDQDPYSKGDLKKGGRGNFKNFI